MPNTAPPARFDMSWKVALSHAFRAFMDFFFSELAARIDWSKRPRFRDKELAAIGLGGSAGGIVADKLVEVCLRGDSMLRILVHVEVQTQRDSSLARRVLDYNYRIFNEHNLPVASLVLLTDDDGNWHPHAFHNDVLGTVMGISFATAKLLDYAVPGTALLASDNPFAWISMAHLRTQQARHDPAALYAAKWEMTRLLYQHGWRKKRIIVLFNVINWMMVLPEQHQQRYWRAVLKLEKELNMECMNPLEQWLMDKGVRKGLKEGMQQGRQQGLEQGLERGLKQGMEQGLEQGLARGRMEGAVALLERQLVRRFGPLSQTVLRKLAKASPAQLERWSDALLEAQSLKQVFG